MTVFLSVLLATVLVPRPSEPAGRVVEAYVRENMPKTVRTNVTDEATLIAVPKPYTVACISGMFREMYYWGEYFNNLALLRLGDVEQARNNVDDVAYLIDWFGFMPNGNRTYYLTRSQPPFFTLMVRDIYERIRDQEWLGRMYGIACREYRFWQEKRMSPSGLNRYSGVYPDDARRRSSAAYFCERVQEPLPEDEASQLRLAECAMAYYESGWDCSSRFRHNAHEANWVCHNALLYGMEMDMARFAETLSNGESGQWKARAGRREKLMNELMWDEEKGLFCDYDFVGKTKLDLVSAASFYPLFAGLATPEQAARTRALLPRIECEYGIAGCENRNLQDLQWDYPHGWPPLQHIVVSGLLRYGYVEDARRIAAKFCTCVEKVFAETGRLWEKYDVTKGEVSVNKEYQSPSLLGWTAGAYLYCQEVCRDAKKSRQFTLDPKKEVK